MACAIGEAGMANVALFADALLAKTMLNSASISQRTVRKSAPHEPTGSLTKEPDENSRCRARHAGHVRRARWRCRIRFGRSIYRATDSGGRASGAARMHNDS